MAFVIHPMDSDTAIALVNEPFNPQPVFSTRLFKEQMEGEHHYLEIAKDILEKKQQIAFLYQAIIIVLQKEYNLEIPVEIPFTFKQTNTVDQSVKYYKARVDTKYLRIKTKGEVKRLTHEEIEKLVENDKDLDSWLEKIPLNKYIFQGFIKLTFTDITQSYVLSELKSDLLRKETFLTDEGYNRILEKIRSLIANPHVKFGFAAVPDFESVINRNYLWKTIIPQTELICEQYVGTIYEKAYREKHVVISRDLAKIEKDVVVSALLKQGIRSHAIVPLLLEDKVVGMIEFGCKEPGALNMLQIKVLYELFPIFALALKRSQEDWQDKVRAIIQEKFTAIHPTVEWRFREVAANMLSHQDAEGSSAEPIVFSDIVPIYGAFDIRASSVERNNAIQHDLIEQLELASQVVDEVEKTAGIPLISNLSYKIESYLKLVKIGVRAGDEVSIIEFLKKEIDPVFQLIQDRYDVADESISRYFDRLDPELGMLYHKRREYEDSVAMINDKVSELIDQEQEQVQKVFPHYFEKYRTDGVEYNAYIGQSLVKDLKYDEIYLKNLRLWQLMLSVKVARSIHALQPQLKTKLEITQLILLHSNPLTVVFRQDEKKFDVAGAYNIRYEITKKRIDKALIKGTNERLTQVGKIAIIYSHVDEVLEYRRFIDYLIARKFIKRSVEDLELEDLKGASGLRALRVEVNFNSSPLNAQSVHDLERGVE